ncbi:hypothetical protein KI387_017951 [Taxus chinensis]|uniref:Sulfite exporter TauE/SafE family protein n=1 Tax=Taxus chinensis TaxID=29808 RepID=A0AA38GJG6_TAXCH|nr:hypothetical protein KI387_017951 [Taxus chinensis]
MKVSRIPPLRVAALLALLSIEVCSFAANLDVTRPFQESWSKNTNAPGGMIGQLDCHGTERTVPTRGKLVGGAFQWKKHEPNGRIVIPTWPPLRFGMRTASATVLIVAAASVSSAGGIGGGGLFVPILNLVLQFDSRTSAAISAFMVLGGSVANVICYVPRRHPEFDGEPLIDYDIALLLQPNMLLGISLGVICNVMFPEWLITSLLASFLSVITFSSCKNARRQWQAETFVHQRNSVLNPDKNNRLSSAHEDGLLQEKGLRSSPSSRNIAIDCSNGTPNGVCNGAHKQTRNVRHSGDMTMQVPSSTVSQEGKESLQEPLLNVRSGQPSTIPLKKMTLLVLMWVSFYLVYILTGGQDKKPCGLGYWLMSGLQILLALAITIWMITQSGDSEKHHNQQASSQATKGCETFLFSFMALVAGILGGMLGLGGGMIINPFLLQMGLPPQVTAATCAFMVFFSASMSVAQFLLLGLAPLDYALFFAITCFISAIFGLSVIQRAITKHGRVSLIIFSVSTVMATSAILMTTFGAIDIWRQYQHGDYMGFRAPC